jgi:hypothetical protein
MNSPPANASNDATQGETKIERSLLRALRDPAATETARANSVRSRHSHMDRAYGPGAGKDPYIGPLPPHLAVVIWPNSGNKPQMHQNAEVHAHVPALDTRSDAAVVRKRQLRARHLRENDDGLTKQLSLECRLFLVT